MQVNLHGNNFCCANASKEAPLAPKLCSSLIGAAFSFRDKKGEFPVKWLEIKTFYQFQRKGMVYTAPRSVLQTVAGNEVEKAALQGGDKDTPLEREPEVSFGGCPAPLKQNKVFSSYFDKKGWGSLCPRFTRKGRMAVLRTRFCPNPLEGLVLNQGNKGICDRRRSEGALRSKFILLFQ